MAVSWYSAGVQRDHITVHGFNSRREWCLANVGLEHEDWRHVWVATAHGYEWLFSSEDKRFMFLLAWSTG